MKGRRRRRLEQSIARLEAENARLDRVIAGAAVGEVVVTVDSGYPTGGESFWRPDPTAFYVGDPVVVRRYKEGRLT